MLNRVEAIWTRAPRQLLAALVFWNARRHGHSGHGDLVPLLSTPQELGAVRSLPYTPCSQPPFLLFCRHTALRAAEGLSHGPLRLVPGPLHGLWAASLAFQRPPSPRKRQTWAPGLSYHRDRRHRHQHCHLRHKRPFSVSPLDLCASCSFLLELFFFFFPSETHEDHSPSSSGLCSSDVSSWGRLHGPLPSSSSCFTMLRPACDINIVAVCLPSGTRVHEGQNSACSRHQGHSLAASVSSRTSAACFCMFHPRRICLHIDSFQDPMISILQKRKLRSREVGPRCLPGRHKSILEPLGKGGLCSRCLLTRLLLGLPRQMCHLSYSRPLPACPAPPSMGRKSCPAGLVVRRLLV